MDARTDTHLLLSGARPAGGGARLTLPVEGLRCASCVGHVEHALSALPGVKEVSVNLATGKASLLNTAGLPIERVARAIAESGYAVPEAETAIGVDGMNCASCVGRVEAALEAIPGVTRASVNLATGRATLRHTSGTLSLEDAEQAVRAAGYTPHVLDTAGTEAPDHEARQARETRGLWRDVTIAALLSAPVVLLAMGEHVLPGFQEVVTGWLGQRGASLVQAVFATAVLVWPGRRFFASGIPGLLRGHPDMNALVALGAGTAYLASMAAVFLPDLLPEDGAHLYFEASALIVTLILVGRALEARSRGRAGAAISRLLDLAPKMARLVRGGQEHDVPAAALAVGDRVRVRPGEHVPADGRIVEGATWIDESMVTGEAEPVRRAEGAAAIGGTVNGSGSFDLVVEQAGSDSLLSQIARMVETAQGGKLPVQNLVDRITARFVPAVLIVAAATALAWLALSPSPSLGPALVHAIAVLVIACPCAMGLAVPMSIMVGTGRAAERGVLFRNGGALQALCDVKAIAFDKTGTLTEGGPRLTEVLTADGISRREVLEAAAAVEARSEHPLARAIVAAAKEQAAVPDVEGFESVAGMGVRGRVAGRAVVVGAARWMESLGVALADLGAETERLGRAGHTPVYVAIDGRFAALIAVADPIRADAAAVVHALQARGIVVAMITGDDRRTAESVANTLGIDAVSAEVLPEGKLAALQEVRSQHGAVAFVGDGVNDAPALAEAEVGVAIGSGTDVAIESADVVLMSKALTSVDEAVALSAATMANIRQNLFWAFAYNVALIPVAAGALAPLGVPALPPIVAASAMALSSIFVVLNALRLRRAGAGPRPA